MPPTSDSKNSLSDRTIRLTDEIRDALSFFAAEGITGFDCSPRTLKILEGWTGQPLTGGREGLSDIRDDLGDCSRCGLSRTRNHIVFGEGNPDARLVFVGEGPGHDEDVSGRPFVGPAGQLLTRIIQAMGLAREDVYICNIIKCRPPRNRDPQPEEVAICSPFLWRQIRAVAPEAVCALGSVAARFLLNTQTPISRLRGRFHETDGILVMPTFHPAFLLRNPEKKRETWHDIQLIMKKLGLEPPQK
jgi:DNA polymerase